MADAADGGTDSTEGTGQESTEDAQGTDKQSTDSTEDDFDSLPEATKAEIRKLRKENRTLRKAQPKTTSDDKGTDPQAALLAKLTELLGGDMGTPPKAPATDNSASELRTARIELAAYKAATAAGADPDALLDSRSFLREIEDLDPTDASFEKDLREAAKAALGANPSLKAKSGGQQKAPPGKSGGDLAGGKSPGLQEFLDPQQRLAAAYAANNS
jgi:hypothetical protein